MILTQLSVELLGTCSEKLATLCIEWPSGQVLPWPLLLVKEKREEPTGVEQEFVENLSKRIQ